jgi:hypothetical protein
MKVILTVLFIIFASITAEVVRLYKSRPDQIHLHNLGLIKEVNKVSFTGSQDTITFPLYDL